MYNGCPAASALDFNINRLKPKHGKIQYSKENEMEITKTSQFSPSKPLCQRKPGPKRQLALDGEVLLVLMGIRLDSSIEDLAFLHDMHQRFLQLSRFF